MAFPNSDLPVQLLVYLGADPDAADPTTDWPSPTDMSTRLIRDEGITISAGRRDGATTMSPGSCSFTLSNVDGKLTPLHPASEYYSQWDIGTPVALLVTDYVAPNDSLFRGLVDLIEPDYIPQEGGGVLTVVRVTCVGIADRLAKRDISRSLLRSLFERNFAEDPSLPVSHRYWPMEETTGNRFVGTIGAPADGTIEGTITLADFADVHGSLPLPTIGTGGMVSFTVTTPPGSWDYAVWTYLFAFPSAGLTDSTRVARAYLGTGDQTSTMVYTTASSGTVTANSTSITGVNGKWLALTFALLDTNHDGTSTLNYAYSLYDPVTDSRTGSDSLAATGSGVYTATQPRLVRLEIGHTSLTPIGLSFGHLSVRYALSADTVKYLVPGDGFMDQALGRPGESPGVRFGRVLDEWLVPNAEDATGPTMGRQQYGTLWDAVVEAETASGGRVYENRSAYKISLNGHEELENPVPAITIDYDTYNYSEGTPLASIVAPQRDTRGQVNDWTTTDLDGASAVARDEAHIARHGRLASSATVSVDTAQALLDAASWRLGLTTTGSIRQRVVSLDLGANPSLIADWLGMTLGSAFLERTNLPTDLYPVGLYPDASELLKIEGYTQTIKPRSWDVKVVVSPGKPWLVGELDVQRLAEDEDCAIRAAITSGSTSIAFDPNYMRWTTTGGDYPSTALLESSPASPTSGGEQVTVSAMATTAATYVAVGTAAHASNAAVSPGNYAGGAANDWVIVVGRVRTSTATLAISDANYTYTLLQQQGGLYVWAALRTGTNPAPTVTPSGGVANMTVSAQVFGLRNMPITLSLDRYLLGVTAPQSNASAQNIAYGALPTGSFAGRVILLVAGKSDDWTSAAPPSGFTEISEATSTTGDDQSLYIAYRIDTTPASVTNSSIVVTGGGSAVSESMVLALAGGFQTATVTRGSGAKAHGAGTYWRVADPLRLTL